jgi:hypothetical protein
MTATDRLRALLDERGVKYETNEDERDLIAEPERTAWEYSQCGYEMYVVATEAVDVEGKPYLDMDFHHYHTPEQAIAATLGSVPDEIELTQTYDAGFRNGVMAVFQQLEGIDDYEELQCFIAEYWGEGEGNDEP